MVAWVSERMWATLSSHGEGRRSCAGLHPERGWQVADNLVEVIALILLPVAVLMCAYALTVFVWRSRAISKKTVRPHAARCLSRWSSSAARCRWLVCVS